MGNPWLAISDGPCGARVTQVTQNRGSGAARKFGRLSGFFGLVCGEWCGFRDAKRRVLEGLASLTGVRAQKGRRVGWAGGGGARAYGLSTGFYPNFYVAHDFGFADRLVW